MDSLIKKRSNLSHSTIICIFIRLATIQNIFQACQKTILIGMKNQGVSILKVNFFSYFCTGLNPGEHKF